MRCGPAVEAGTGESGAASLVVVALIGVLLLLGTVFNFMVATAAAHRAVQSAADLAALAGATSGQVGGEPCAAAAEVAAANGVQLAHCTVTGEEVLVEARGDGPVLFGHSFSALGRARAGPAPPM